MHILVWLQEERVIGEFLDAAKEETITALRAELARLQHSQHAQQAADSALASLQQKIDSLQVSTMFPGPSFIHLLDCFLLCRYCCNRFVVHVVQMVLS